MLGDGARFQLEIGTVSSDVASVSGAVTLSGIMPLEVVLTAQPLADMAYTFITATGGILDVTGTARFSYLGNTLENGELFTVIGDFTQTFSISYDANSVAVKAVPEPGSATALLGGLGVLLGIRRRR